MNLRQLEAFRAVMLTGSATQAAKMIFISQPAVSRLISDLEFRIGFKLFIRKPNKLQPTSEAQALFLEVQRSFVGISQIERAAKAIKNQQQGCLRMVVTPLIVDSFMPELISQFVMTHPSINIELEVAPKIQASKLIRSHQIDFAILPLPAEREQGLTRQVFAEHNPVCVMPKKHPLAAKKIIDLKDLNQQKYLCLSQGSPFRIVIDGLLQQQDIEPNVVVETRHQNTLYELVKKGLGLAILDPLIVNRDDDTVAVRPISQDISWKYALVYSQDRPVSLLAQAFINAVVKYFEKPDAESRVASDHCKKMPPQH